MAAKKTTKAGKSNTKETIAKQDDGTVQITFTIPFATIDAKRKQAAEELGKNIDVPGFRRGMAPIDKLIEHIPQNTLLEQTLSKILPNLVGEAIKKHKLNPVMYPKFDLVKAVDGEDWQVRATTAELPEITLGDYKKAITGAARAKSLWTPGKGKPDDNKKPPSRAEKEQEVVKLLLENIKFQIPKILIDEEVNSRLAKLLAQIEKLGLSLDSYLSSSGKTAQTLRAEYEKQAHDSITLDLILDKIATEEKIAITDEQIKETIKGYSQDPKVQESLNTPEQHRTITAVMKKRAALDRLTSLLGA